MYIGYLHYGLVVPKDIGENTLQLKYGCPENETDLNWGRLSSIGAVSQSSHDGTLLNIFNGYTNFRCQAEHTGPWMEPLFKL